MDVFVDKKTGIFRENAFEKRIQLIDCRIKYFGLALHRVNGLIGLAVLPTNRDELCNYMMMKTKLII